MNRILLRLLAGAVCAALLGGCFSRVEPDDRRESEDVPESSAAEPEAPVEEVTEPPVPAFPRADFDLVTAEVDLTLPGALALASPTEDTTTTAAAWYITGLSDPDLPLTLNDEAVEGRGNLGSFGVYAELEEGDNTFTFAQGGESVTVTITQEEPQEGYRTTDVATRMRPELDAAALAGEEYLLSCVAPSGAAVTARAGAQTVELTQAAATAVEGVPATFTGTLVPGDTEGTADLGPVVYTVTYGGNSTEYPSAGRLFAVGKDAELVVRGRDSAATTFTEDSDASAPYGTLVQGGRDVVTEIGSGLYKLGGGGWVLKSAVEPLEGKMEWKNQVSDVSFASSDHWEAVTLHGTSAPPYQADWGSDGEYRITLRHTAGIGEIALENSRLLQSIDVQETDGDTVLTFRYADGVAPGGYLVRYDENDTTIYVKRAPALSADADKPLAGLIIVVDPGHGGTDGGALGVAESLGPEEQEINLATAKALRAYLIHLGAEVVMTREDNDTSLERSERQDRLRIPEADLAISLHSNSIPVGRDGNGPGGVEVYYFEPQSQKLAENLQAAVCAATGRIDRGAQRAHFWIALNSGAPTAMVEMGFLTNPADYDAMCGKEGIYAMAEGIVEGILQTLA